MPIRHKEISVINLHPSVKFAVEFGLKIVSEKLKSRIHFYAKLLDSEVLDLTVLPKEYGGTMPMEKMISMFSKTMFNRKTFNETKF